MDNNGTHTDDEFVEIDANFVAAPLATQGDFNPIKLSYLTTPNRDWNDQELMNLKAIVARFDQNLLMFYPRLYISDGSSINWECRNSATGFQNQPSSDKCRESCQNAGRYCVNRFDDHDEEHGLVTGAQIVTEGARRLCIWMLHNNANSAHLTGVMTLWNYLAEFQRSQCSTHLSDECWNEVYQNIGMTDSAQVEKCLDRSGGISVELDRDNQILGEEMHRSRTFNATSLEALPQMTINEKVLDKQMPLSTFNVLKSICDDYPSNQRPKVCGFCAHYCPNVRNSTTDSIIRQCLWEMHCGKDEGGTFDDWVANGELFSNVEINFDFDHIRVENDVNSTGNAYVSSYSESNDATVEAIPFNETINGGLDNVVTIDIDNSNATAFEPSSFNRTNATETPSAIKIVPQGNSSDTLNINNSLPVPQSQLNEQHTTKHHGVALPQYPTANKESPSSGNEANTEGLSGTESPLDINVTEQNITNFGVTEQDITNVIINEQNITHTNVTEQNITNVDVQEQSIAHDNATQRNITHDTSSQQSSIHNSGDFHHSGNSSITQDHSKPHTLPSNSRDHNSGHHISPHNKSFTRAPFPHTRAPRPSIGYGADWHRTIQHILWGLIFLAFGVTSSFFIYRRWRSLHGGIYSSTRKGDFQPGLAGSASHCVAPGDLDLEVHVEMNNLGNSNYAPPSTASLPNIT